MKKTPYFKHPTAIVESKSIGKKTRVWAFAHILPAAVIGEDCNICDHTFIENDVVIGNRVTIKCGVQLWDGVTLEDDVFIGPNVTFTNDPFPRSKQRPKKFLKTIVRKGASIGANSTILPGIVIGRYAMVGAGSVVTKDVPPYAIVVGNPARVNGYVSLNSRTVSKSERSSKAPKPPGDVKVPGVKILELPLITDQRGSLSFGQYDQHIPFSPKRYFVIYNVPEGEVRGQHAHKRNHQFVVCVKGACSVIVDDGRNRDEVLLDHPGLGLYVPPMIWTVVTKFSPDAVQLVLASDVYLEEDYIRDYDEFVKAVGQR